MNSEFFSLTGWSPRVEGPVRPTVLPLPRGENRKIHALAFSIQLYVRLSASPIYTANYQYNSKVKLATIVEGNPKAPFSIATTPRCRGGRYSFPGLLYFTLDPYLIMLSVKQGGIKYHFLSLF